MTRIYTRTGDEGQTSLFGGGRVPKETPRVDAYGEVDELNAALGFALSLELPIEVEPTVQSIQIQLFTVGAELATPEGTKADGYIPHLPPEWVTQLEERIDALSKELPPLDHFILPGGSQGAGALHLARAICRRAERRVAALSRTEKVDPQVLIYLNRLSDLLFCMARLANVRAGVQEVGWLPKKKE